MFIRFLNLKYEIVAEILNIGNAKLAHALFMLDTKTKKKERSPLLDSLPCSTSNNTKTGKTKRMTLLYKVSTSVCDVLVSSPGEAKNSDQLNTTQKLHKLHKPVLSKGSKNSYPLIITEKKNTINPDSEQVIISVKILIKMKNVMTRLETLVKLDA